MSEPTLFLDGRVALHAGDMLAVLPTLAENSVDSVVCDPPYHLVSIVKRFGKSNLERDAHNLQLPNSKGGTVSPYKRVASGFMGKVWDGGDIAFRPETWAQVLRVMKPGAHLVAFSGTRTYHRMACAIEDAGFEIRDALMWHYGSGFPKSHRTGKAIDEIFGWFDETEIEHGLTSHLGAFFEGHGTALKPATEILCLARKPLSESTIAANVLRWGTGGLNIDGCRVNFGEETDQRVGTDFVSRGGDASNNAADNQVPNKHYVQMYKPNGRWPANLIHDGSPEVLAAFPEQTSPGTYQRGTAGAKKADGWGHDNPIAQIGFGDSGSAARFFYTSKADSDDRLGSRHPTVKPVDLIQWLVRLVTPPGGLVLDCFAGTGTTGEAAFREGMRAILIEREPEYVRDIERRMALVLAGPDERSRESIKANGKADMDAGPLFAGAS